MPKYAIYFTYSIYLIIVINRLKIHSGPNPFWLLLLPLSFLQLH